MTERMNLQKLPSECSMFRNPGGVGVVLALPGPVELILMLEKAWMEPFFPFLKKAIPVVLPSKRENSLFVSKFWTHARDGQTLPGLLPTSTPRLSLVMAAFWEGLP
jgi:hypothetical protein